MSREKSISRTESNHPRVSEAALQDSFSCCSFVAEKATLTSPRGTGRELKGILSSSLTLSDYSICDFGVTVKSFLQVFFRGSQRYLENRYTH